MTQFSDTGPGIEIHEAEQPRRLDRESFRREILRQAERAPKNDPYIRAFSEAYDAIYDMPEVADLIEWFLYIRQRKTPMLPWHAHNQLFRAYQAELIPDEETYDYPASFSKAEAWVEHLLRITREKNLTFETNLWIHSVQSNVSGRYRSMAMLMDVLEDRYPRIGGRQTITALDVGCSLNRGYTHLASSIPFDPVIEAANADLPSVNKRIQNRLRFEGSLGIDLASLNDEKTRLWAESSSMYPSERMNRRLVATYKELDKLQLPGLSFEDGDFVETGPDAKWDPAGRMHPSRVHGYDVVSMYTFLYQLSPEEHTLALQHALDAVKSDGIILIQDFMDTDPKDAHSMRFNNGTSEEWTYGTFALDMCQPEVGLQPLFRWNNGRCEKLELRLNRADPAMRLQGQVFEALAA